MTQRLVRVDEDQYALLKKKSEKTGLAIAMIVRQAIEAWLKRN
jgi:hypothetical protein